MQNTDKHYEPNTTHISSTQIHIQRILHSPTQLSQRLQCEARGGLKILQVKQYFSLTV